MYMYTLQANIVNKSCGKITIYYKEMRGNGVIIINDDIKTEEQSDIINIYLTGKTG